MNPTVTKYLIEVAEGAAIAAAGAVATYVTAWIGAHDLGTWTPVVMAGWALVITAAKKGWGHVPTVD